MGEKKLNYESDIKPKVNLEIAKQQQETKETLFEQFHSRISKSEKTLSNQISSLRDKISESEKTLSEQFHSRISKSEKTGWIPSGVVVVALLGLFTFAERQFVRVDEKIELKFSQLDEKLDPLSEARGITHSSNVERDELTNIKSLNEVRTNPTNTKDLKEFLNSTQE